MYKKMKIASIIIVKNSMNMKTITVACKLIKKYS